MAGVKGRSGTRPKLETEIRKMVIDKCWAQLFFSLCDKKTKQYQKDKIAMVIASKCIPQEVKTDLSGQVVVQMGRVYKDGKPLEFKVGNAIGS